MTKIDAFEGEETFKAAYVLQPVLRNIENVDASNHSVDSQHRVDHVVRDIKRDEVV